MDPNSNHAAYLRLECAKIVAAHELGSIQAERVARESKILADFVLGGNVPGIDTVEQAAPVNLQPGHKTATTSGTGMWLSDAARAVLGGKLVSLQRQLGGTSAEHGEALQNVAVLGLERLKIEGEIAALRRDLGM